ncbi:hypothetical protein ACINWC743_A0344 [Acinetobacter sp. WC-743]|nr:hypothetical protein ACINWC743_A0344 [Acinetobacter sp. WC-743]
MLNALYKISRTSDLDISLGVTYVTLDKEYDLCRFMVK